MPTRDLPDLSVTPAAQAGVQAFADSWARTGGDMRDLGLAMLVFGHAVLLVVDGRDDHLALCQRAAEFLDPHNTKGTA